MARAPALLWRSFQAERVGRKAGIPGMEFDRFGRRLGLRLIAAGHATAGANYLLNPVSITRYWEFAFAAGAVPDGARKCLDVSSPRLFSLFWAARHPGATVLIVNPDEHDLSETEVVARTARIEVDLSARDIAALEGAEGAFDAIWCLSVIEHVHGSLDDSSAMVVLHSLLRPGGVMAITTNVDRKAWDEYRDVDPYGLSTPSEGRAFFQHWYDLDALQTRLIKPLGAVPAELSFFGEVRPGTFKRYEAEWMQRGLRRSVDDPAEIARDYRSFQSWDEMPGAGVCGIVIRKPAGVG